MINIQNLSEKTAKLYNLLKETGLSEDAAYEAMANLDKSMYRSIIEDAMGKVEGNKLNELDKLYENNASEEQIAAFLNLDEAELQRRMEEKLELYCKNLTAGISFLKTQNQPSGK